MASLFWCARHGSAAVASGSDVANFTTAAATVANRTLRRSLAVAHKGGVLRMRRSPRMRVVEFVERHQIERTTRAFRTHSHGKGTLSSGRLRETHWFLGLLLLGSTTTRGAMSAHLTGGRTPGRCSSRLRGSSEGAAHHEGRGPRHGDVETRHGVERSANTHDHLPASLMPKRCTSSSPNRRGW